MKPSTKEAARPGSRAAVDLAIDDLVTGYGRAEILHGVSLSVPTGKVTTVLGRNGVGKTTLLRCLSGLIPARGGRISFGGADITGWPSSRRVSAGLAHVPEGRRMVPGFTVRQNLLLGAYVLPRREAEPRLAEIVGLFPVIGQWLGRESTSLSGGQQQLVAIARALMSRPRVLLLDEPLTGLHPSIAADVTDSVRRLASAGLTILLVEQNVHLAVEVADSVCVVDAGRVAMLDNTPREDIAEEIERVYLGVELPGVGADPDR
ncbi:MAG: ABC transporter ATP-binding protein [Nocardiopsaceae bacterium]|nr:ABC transporter ATP-binding protein [Nocardiopsaceae bacterium]